MNNSTPTALREADYDYIAARCKRASLITAELTLATQTNRTLSHDTRVGMRLVRLRKELRDINTDIHDVFMHDQDAV